MTHHEPRSLDDVDTLEVGPRGSFEHRGWFYSTQLHAGNFTLSRQRLVQVHPYDKLGPLEGPVYLLARADGWELLDNDDNVVGSGPTWQDAVRGWR